MKQLSFKINKKWQRGFTLIEIIVVISIMGVVANVVAMMLYQAIRATSAQFTFSDTQTEARYSLSRLTKEINRIRNHDDTLLDISNPNQLSFTDTDGKIITYFVSNNQLMRREQSIAGETVTARSLADSVTTLTFTYFDEDGEITTTTENVRLIKPSVTFNKTNKLGNNHLITIESIINPPWF